MKIEIEVNKYYLDWIVDSLYMNLDDDDLMQIGIIEYLEREQNEKGNEMTDEQIINKFRQALKGYIETDDVTSEEIEEIIDEALSQLNLTNELIVEQFRKGEANGISGNTQFNILNLLTMKVKQEELMKK